MLMFNLKRALNLKGIKYPIPFFLKQGFTRSVASSLARFPYTLPAKHLEKLCLTFNCTPNDLFDWKPDAQHDKPDYALYELKRAEESKSFTALTENMKMKDLMNVLDEVKKKKE